MVSGLKNRELLSRLSNAISPDRVLSPGSADEKLERIILAVVYAMGLAALLGVLLACFLHGQPDEAKAWTQALLAIALQTFAVVMTAPAFVPSNTQNRLAQLYLPLSNQQISQPWFQRIRGGILWLLSMIGFMVLVCLCCRVPLRWIVTNVFWQTFVVGLIVHAAYAIVGRKRRHGWFGVTLWWIAVSATGLGVFGLQVLQPEAPAFFAFAFWAVLKTPDFIAKFAGINVSMVVSAILFACVVMPWKRRRRLASPSHRQIRNVCRFWRTLPDREDPIVGNLNFPSLEMDATKVGSKPQPEEPQTRQIRDEIKRPHSQLLMTTAIRRKARVYALLITLPMLVMATVTEIMTTKAGFPRRSTLGLGVVTWHIPAFWSMVGMGAFTGSGLVHIGNAYRLAIRGMWRDTLVIALLCAPCIAVIGHFTGDYTSSAMHVGMCLAVGIGLRVLSGALAWLPYKLLDASLMFYACFGAFLVASVNGLDGELVAMVTVGCPLILGLMGWDRIAKVLHAPVNQIRERCQRR